MEFDLQARGIKAPDGSRLSCPLAIRDDSLEDEEAVKQVLWGAYCAIRQYEAAVKEVSS